MLGPLLPQLAAKRVVLASASPRRREILQQIGLRFEVVVSRFEESLDAHCYSPESFVLATAEGKADEVFGRLDPRADLLISCDTMVVLDGAVIGKPRDAADAASTLRRLSGRDHEVWSGVVLRSASGETVRFSERSTVHFATLDEEQIATYVGTGEPMDKAGAYGIQGIGGSLISGIDGCFYNIMGFPMHRFCEQLRAHRSLFGLT